VKKEYNGKGGTNIERKESRNKWGRKGKCRKEYSGRKDSTIQNCCSASLVQVTLIYFVFSWGQWNVTSGSRITSQNHLSFGQSHCNLCHTFSEKSFWWRNHDRKSGYSAYEEIRLL